MGGVSSTGVDFCDLRFIGLTDIFFIGLNCGGFFTDMPVFMDLIFSISRSSSVSEMTNGALRPDLTMSMGAVSTPDNEREYATGLLGLLVVVVVVLTVELILVLLPLIESTCSLEPDNEGGFLISVAGSDNRVLVDGSIPAGSVRTVVLRFRLYHSMLNNTATVGNDQTNKLRGEFAGDIANQTLNDDEQPPQPLVHVYAKNKSVPVTKEHKTYVSIPDDHVFQLAFKHMFAHTLSVSLALTMPPYVSYGNVCICM